MGIKIELLNETLMAGLPAFADQVWAFPPGDAFLRWRIADPPGSRYYVAHKDGEWLAAIGGYHKTYLNAGVPVDCLETYAWASRDVREARGLGIKVMKALMDEGKPLVALGGSPDTLNYMPRLGFETLAMAPSLVLPVRAGFARDMAGAKGMLARAGIAMISTATRPHHHKSRLRVQPLARFDLATLAMPSLPGFQAIYEPALFDWQTGWADQGAFLPIRFVRDSEIVGWVYARVTEEEPGLLAGRILEMKFGAGTSASEHLDMVRAVIAAMCGFGVTVIRALTSCPDTNAALRKCHFRSRSESPAMVYGGDMIDRTQPVRVSVLRADGGAQPLRRDALSNIRDR